ncbi:hypothetical protein [Clostridium sp. BNL1100]|uniref:hypothetical protein n=1 Tax=Clostridium sp. BNL1100 TaxID=755731 RepID=UPI00024A7AE0|nr:hypothetical protein [Clostridium sp. BNL1100]AEY67464.1 hypothetical protein Clo1100_3319 [Clostridium sp. BNL1100]
MSDISMNDILTVKASPEIEAVLAKYIAKLSKEAPEASEALDIDPESHVASAFGLIACCNSL